MPNLKKMKVPIFQVVAKVGKIQTMEPDGLKWSIYTNEVAPDEMAMMMQLRGKQGNMLFAPADYDFSEKDIEDLPEVRVEAGEKTPSQRLRATLYVRWEQTGGKARKDKKTFEQFYREQMERFINAVKEKLK